MPKRILHQRDFRVRVSESRFAKTIIGPALILLGAGSGMVVAITATAL